MGIFNNSFGLLLLTPFILPLVLPSTNGSLSLFTLNEVAALPQIMWYSGITLAVLSFWAISQRTTVTNAQLVIYLLFLPLVYFFVSTNNILVFFMCYEFFLLPSFLIVFLGSPNRSGVLASIYFLMWTQVGSFLVFVAILLIFLTNSSFLLTATTYVSTLPAMLCLIGFGINIPMWPAHYWLTNTHVEAPTYFSIYLSGFLVNTALYGVWLFSHTNSVFSHSLFLLVATVGVIDSSLKMWAQVDLNNLVAYGTVQEMNLILIGFILGSSTVVKAAALFILAHTILSTIFFLFADSLYSRFSARSTSSVSGLLQSMPNLGYTLFVCCLFFAGLPFTLNFVVEVFIFTQLFNVSLGLVCACLFICNWFGIISFMKNWFIPLFGSPNTQSSDLSFSELLIYSTLCALLILLSFLGFYLI